MPQLPGPERESLSSRFNRVLAIGIWIISAVISVSLFFVAQPSQIAYLVPLAFVNLLVWEALWRPVLVVSDGRIEVTNPFRSIEIPWESLVNVDTKFALTLFTPGRRFEVWIAPSPGRSFGYSNAILANREVARLSPNSTSTVRPGDLASSESGAAASIVRSRWELLQASGLIEAGIADVAQVTVRWHWSTIVAAVLLLAAAIPALLIA